MIAYKTEHTGGRDVSRNQLLRDMNLNHPSEKHFWKAHLLLIFQNIELYKEAAQEARLLSSCSHLLMWLPNSFSHDYGEALIDDGRDTGSSCTATGFSVSAKRSRIIMRLWLLTATSWFIVFVKYDI